MTNGSQQLDLEDQRVARNNLLTELHTVDLHEVSRPALRLLEGVQYQQTATLCHRLDLENTRHDWLLWEVSLEERLVGGDVLDTYDGICTQFYYLIDQLHRIAVR